MPRHVVATPPGTPWRWRKVRNATPTIVFTMTHPHDVHLFRNAINELSARGCQIHVFVHEKEMTSELLERFQIPHTVLAGNHLSKVELFSSWTRFGVNLLRKTRRIKPDLMVAEVGAAAAPVSWLAGNPSLIFMDAEHARLQNSLVLPFATRICTSTCFWKEIGSKQVRYEGYQELAYLHPDRFEPDPSVLDEAGIGEDERFVILRAVGWNAAHDVNAGGFNGLARVIEALEAEGVTVVVTSERELPADLRSYQLSIEPHRIHDLMYYAELFIGESATMATESAILGTPAIYVSTLEVGYTAEIARDYGLIFNYAGADRQQRGIDQAKAILDGRYQADWEARWQELIADKRDTTDVILEQIQEMTGLPEREVIQ